MFAFLLAGLGLVAGQTIDGLDDHWPYGIGPMEFDTYKSITGIETHLVGRAYARINRQWDEIEFKYELDNIEEYPEYRPFFASHVHHGKIDEGETGHVVISISGKGHIVGCWSLEVDAETDELNYIVCSEKCLDYPYAKHCSTTCSDDIIDMNDPLGPFFDQLNPFSNPNSPEMLKYLADNAGQFPHICNLTLGYAVGCNGGCDGDQRGTYGDFAVASSRMCDAMDDKAPSDVALDTWVAGKYSHEFSGNEEDGDEYSKWSMYKDGNFDKFCGIKINFLREMLSEGHGYYIAFHTDFNTTGTPSLDFGDLLTVLNDGSGAEVYDRDGNPVRVPTDEDINSCSYRVEVEAFEADKGAEACPSGSMTLEADTCQAFAEQEGDDFELKSSSKYPHGCYKKSSKYAYNSKSGAANDNAAPVCAEVEIVRGDKGTYDCPEGATHMTKKQCKQYAADKDKDFSSKDSDNYPQGCYKKGSKYYFNEETGAANSKASPVCYM